MKKIFWAVLVVFLSFHLVGCAGTTIRKSVTYEPRVDQEIEGNRGFLHGEPTEPPKEPSFKERKIYRIEVEIPNLPWNVDGDAKIASTTSTPPPSEDTQNWGNQGFISGTPSEEVGETPIEESKIEKEFIAEKSSIEIPTRAQVQTSTSAKAGKARTYTVQKKDTLQKISQKFYGTTKKWSELYKANRNVLKDANHVYPGEVIVIPDLDGYKK